MLLNSVLSVLATAALALAAPLQHTYPNATAETVYQFPNNTWVENLAVRANGKILATLITSPELWQIDPLSRTAELLHTFPDAAGTLGIAEVEEDVFIAGVGNWSVSTFNGAKGSWSLWLVDLRRAYGYGSQPYSLADGTWPRVRKVTDIPGAVFLNGITALPTKPHTVLVGDSTQGLIYRVDTETGDYGIAIDNPAFKPDAAARAQLGVNGIHVHGDYYLYFTNSFDPPVLARIPMSANGSATGPVEVLVSNATFPNNLAYHGDDFTFDVDGNVWLTTDVSDSLVKISPDGKDVRVVLGGPDDAIVAGDTSAAFGRTRWDRDTLYITTNGGVASPPTGGIVGGKLLALDTRSVGL